MSEKLKPSALKPLAYYQEHLEILRKKNKYAKNWKLEIVRKTNRHVDCSGHSWGWYEIFPLEITIGFWDNNFNALEGFDIAEWNRRAGGIA